MEGVLQYLGPVGVGLIVGGVLAVRLRRKKLEKSSTIEKMVGPIMLAIGICLVIAKGYGDYQEARTPLSPDKALDRAMKSFRPKD